MAPQILILLFGESKHEELEGMGIGSDSISAGTRGRAEKYGNVGHERGVLPESDEQYRLT